MEVFRSMKKLINNNLYLFVGILVGMYISSLISPPPSYVETIESSNLSSIFNAPVQTYTNTSKTVPKRTDSAKKPKPIRPRYYSTELGIREKLFVGVLTSEERINTQAVHINATIGHATEKLKFFITAKYKLQNKFNLSGVVGFTDMRQKYRPFQVFKYIGDSFLLDYDYFFLINDYSFVNIRALKDVVNRISVSSNVYLGTPVPESSFCSLGAGILLSNSVVKAVRENLEWCVSNAISEDHSENIGRCIYHSTKLDCQEEVQNKKLTSFKLKHSALNKKLEKLSKNREFTNAVVVYPIMQATEFYLLNAFYARQRLEKLKAENDVLSADLKDSWPPGHRIGNKPPTRFDQPRTLFFNTSHMFFSDDFTNVQPHTKADLRDINNVIESIVAKVMNQYPNRYQYRRFVNGYRTFDLSRGMDYEIDLGFRDLTTGKEVIKRFEVCKPLGKVEFTPVPYVTENTRVTIILPVQESEITLARGFLGKYLKTVTEKNDKSFLMLVLLYQYSSPSKNSEDVFAELKTLALKMLNKNGNEDAKVAWVSIRLPNIGKTLVLEEYGVLNYGVIDLALKKIGLESLNLVLSVYSEISVPFLNRVRMNTIEGFQVFSPIPYRQYNPMISQVKSFEINKNVGHFDREEYRYISFYSRDYVNARKKSQEFLPIVKVDYDIIKLINSKQKRNGNILDMFLKYSENMHCMRATEPNLKVKYHDEVDESRSNWFLGNTAQLATLLLNKKLG